MSNRLRDIVCACVFLAFGIFMFTSSLSIKPIIPNEVGSGYVPRFLSIVIIVISSALLVVTLINKKIGKTEKVDEDVKAGMLTIAALAIYVAAFQPVGFLLSSILYLFFQTLILSTEKNRSIPRFAIISVAVPIALDVLFKYLFQMSFPTGILGI